MLFRSDLFARVIDSRSFMLCFIAQSSQESERMVFTYV
jgi:hypothetical protein